jgi:hypothetical protein
MADTPNGAPSSIPTDPLSLAFKLGALITEAIIREIQAGDTKTTDALRAVLKSPEALLLMDEATRAAQRAKAHAKLGTRR